MATAVTGESARVRANPGSLHVIALVSGGKDSFYSILHCRRQGHEVVALANLYPLTKGRGARDGRQCREGERDGVVRERHGRGTDTMMETVDAAIPAAEVQLGARDRGEERQQETAEGDGEGEQDLNSFMYQTVGHTVVPLYAEALELPLYRQMIRGSAVHTGLSYDPAALLREKHSDTDVRAPDTKPSRGPGNENAEQEETESLVPLLRTIMAAHPTANALSTGAILSTYQRTRIESVALRLGLVPLSFLWQYPNLPPGTQRSLLEDMCAVGLDARIVKVASAGLDATHLWENVASAEGMARIARAMARFGNEADGAVVGEGGEFETLVLDGPRELFRKRIVVADDGRRVVREEGGAAWLAVEGAKLELKSERNDDEMRADVAVRIPDLFDQEFLGLFKSVSMHVPLPWKTGGRSVARVPGQSWHAESGIYGQSFTFVASRAFGSDGEVQNEALDVIAQIRHTLHQRNKTAEDIIFTTIILRSMATFSMVNQVYGAMFTRPNPPSRVTIACGDALPKGRNLVIHLRFADDTVSAAHRSALHVQSRSYWAPANIGPYSQAQSEQLNSTEEDQHISVVYIAGQIPLIPATMELPSFKDIHSMLQYDAGEEGETYTDVQDNFSMQVVLALQHLWRIGKEVKVSWWTSAVAFVSRDSAERVMSKARVVAEAWRMMHAQESEPDDEDLDDDDNRDLWEEKHRSGWARLATKQESHVLPDWSGVTSFDVRCPPMFLVEVEELPRGAAIEWQAHVGLTHGTISISSRVEKDVGIVFETLLADTRLYRVLFIPYGQNTLSIRTAISRLRRNKTEKAVGNDANDEGEGEIEGQCMTYFDVTVFHTFDVCGPSIPCWSIWGSKGEKLRAVVVLESNV